MFVGEGYKDERWKLKVTSDYSDLHRESAYFSTRYQKSSAPHTLPHHKHVSSSKWNHSVIDHAKRKSSALQPAHARRFWWHTRNMCAKTECLRYVMFVADCPCQHFDQPKCFINSGGNLLSQELCLASSSLLGMSSQRHELISCVFLPVGRALC